MAKWYIGTSGWSYPSWGGVFYPAGLPAREWLSYYSRHYDAVELNSSFYHLPKPEQVERWEKMLPKSFTLAFKGSRFITHTKRLLEPGEPLERMEKCLAVKQPASPIIFQLPPKFGKDAARLEKFLEQLPEQRRHAIEFRDPSWHVEEIYKLLRRYNVAFCMFEKEDNRSPRVATADFLYLRLHGREKNYKGNYSKPVLTGWHRWLADQERDVYVFFDNTNTGPQLYALENARAMQRLAKN